MCEFINKASFLFDGRKKKQSLSFTLTCPNARNDEDIKLLCTFWVSWADGRL